MPLPIVWHDNKASDGYHGDLYNGIIQIDIYRALQTSDPDCRGKYEVQIGLRWYSRDRLDKGDKSWYFSSKHEAKAKVTWLLGQMFKALSKEVD